MKLRLLAAMLLAAIMHAPANADEVAIEHQGLSVVGNLEIAPGKSLKADGVVLILHDTLAHHRMEVISALQELLREKGVNSLAVTLSLGLDQRRGLFDCKLEQDHRHDDAIDELGAWIAWLKEQGASSIILAGHGRGGNQIALFAERAPDKAVRKLVLIAPLSQSFQDAEAEYRRRFGASLAEMLTKAEQLAAEDRGDELLDGVGFLECPRAQVTAAAFADYYSASQRFFTPSLLQALKLPALVVFGDRDPDEAAFSAAMRDLPLPAGVVYERIPGADHFFIDLYAEQLAVRVAAFAQQR